MKAILVTGASSGIGRSITEHFAASGHVVYAGARQTADLRALERIQNVRPLRLDVTKQNDIEAAVATIEAEGRGLYGLINNAGLGSVGSVTNGDIAEFERVMNVNAHAPFRVAQAFVPLIAACRGRIVIIGSIAGILTNEDVYAYSMSKHALEAFTDCLAQEMSALAVSVSIIEPGPCRTRLIHNATERLGSDARFLDLSRYDGPEMVAKVAALAMFDARPKRRYLVVSNESEARLTLEKHIERLAQLNQASSHAFDRATLIEMLDTMLARYGTDQH